MTVPLRFVVGKRHVLFTTTHGLSRVITDFDSDGRVDVLTVVTEAGAWRLFANGTTHGDKPDFVALSTDPWEPEAPTKPDSPSVLPPKR